MAENETLNQWQERERRLRVVMRWMRADMARLSGEYDREAIDKKIRDTYGMDKRNRRAALIDSAEKLIKGEVSMSELRGGRPREFIRKVDVNDFQLLRERANELAQDMSTRKGAYIHAGAEVFALLSVAREIADKYLD